MLPRLRHEMFGYFQIPGVNESQAFPLQLTRVGEMRSIGFSVKRVKKFNGGGV